MTHIEVSDDEVGLVARALHGFRLRLGPNTIEAIGRGMTDVVLTTGEREDIARAALAAIPREPATRWALLRPDADELHDDKATALRIQAAMAEDCEDGEAGYLLYEVREVTG